MERIPISKNDIDQTLAETKVNPFLEGQLKACNLILLLAVDENLIPEQQPLSWHQSLQQLQFLKRIHLNLFRTVAEYGEMTLDSSVMTIGSVGEWRDDRKWIANKEMPSPIRVPHHLYDWWSDLIDFHNAYRNKIERPTLLEEDDIKILADKAYESNLKICCIKPFVDGSNRVARCIENLLRLNFGLPFRIISHEDDSKMKYIEDIKKMQEKYPPG